MLPKDKNSDAQVAATYLINTITGEQGTNWPESLIRTPERFAEAWEFWTSGYAQDPKDVLKVFEEEAVGDGMIFQGSINFTSLCEHHICPFVGIVHIGYIPSVIVDIKYSGGDHGVPIGFGKTRIVGLSKLARLVEIFARRLQVQERMTCQIADAFMEHVKPQGMGCVVRARHLCVESRGIQKYGTTTVTSALRGLFREDEGVRAEYLAFVRSADEGVKAI
jgi:GTP cyclohydrolase I